MLGLISARASRPLRSERLLQEVRTRNFTSPPETRSLAHSFRMEELSTSRAQCWRRHRTLRPVLLQPAERTNATGLNVYPGSTSLAPTVAFTGCPPA
jgi:hypothetical protein